LRTIVKLGVPITTAALILTACGGTKEAGTATSAAGAGKVCDAKIGYFGALTGDAANLGINIMQGAELAVKQYNEKHADCKIEFVKYDSEGDPAKAPALAQKAVQDKKLIGIVGPAFSGESKAANPIFNSAGLNIISASATNPALSQQGWKVFHRVLGNDATQGPAAAKYIKDIVKAAKVYVIDDSSEYGKGLGDQVRTALGATVVGSDAVQQKQPDFSATVTKVTAASADAVFFAGYYAEASKIIKQLRAAGWKGVFVVPDGVKDTAFVQQAGAAATGTVITCPCVPEDVAPEFAQAYQAAYKNPPATYSAEAYDAANVFIDAVAAGKTSSQDVSDFLSKYDKQGVTKKIKFDDKGEPAEVSVWSYKIADGKIVKDQEIK
jgi:branched-chain amino acid transport system substrate-binding protein